jgi:hypothetical protein
VKKYRVSYILRKDSTAVRGVVEVNAESDRTAIKLAQGLVRSRNPQKLEYKFEAYDVRVT